MAKMTHWACLCVSVLLFASVAQAQAYELNWIDFNGDTVIAKTAAITIDDSDELTVSFWFRFQSPADVDDNYLFNIEGTEGLVLAIKVVDGSRLAVSMDSSAPGGPTLINAATPIGTLRPGLIHHVYIHKAAGGRATIRVDDAVHYSAALLPDAVGLSKATGIGIMGRSLISTPRISRGLVADFAFYNTTVPYTAFRNVAGEPLAPPAGALIRFGENQTASDWNIGANTGSLGNFAVISESGTPTAVADFPYYLLNWVSFDGNSSLSMTNAVIARSGGDLDALTISCWLELPSYGGYGEQLIIARDGPTEGSNPVFSVSREAPGQLTARFTGAGGAATLEMTSAVDPNLAYRKHHLLLQFLRDEAGGVAAEMFIDGQSVAAANLPAGGLWGGGGIAASSILQIGVMGTPNHIERMTGSIADLRVYGSVLPLKAFYLPKSVSLPHDGTPAMPPPGSALIALGGSGVYSLHWVDPLVNNSGTWDPFDNVADEIAEGSTSFGVVGIHDVSNKFVVRTLRGKVLANPYASVDWDQEGVTFERMRIQLHDHFSRGGNVDVWERWVAEKYDAQGYDMIPWMHYSGNPYSDYYHPNSGADFKGLIFYAITGDKTGITFPTLGFESPGHGLNIGNTVFLRNVQGMTGINDKSYLVYSRDADSFWLANLDGSAIAPAEVGAYAGGGQVYPVNNNNPWTSMHFPVENFVPYTDPGSPSAWMAGLTQLKFVPGAEEAGGLKEHVLRVFTTNYLEYGADYTDLAGLVALSKSQGAWTVLAHPFYGIDAYKDAQPDAMSIHNGNYFFSTAARGFGGTKHDSHYDNPLINWEKMLRIEPGIRAVATNDRYGLHAFGGAITEAKSAALDSGKVEAFVVDKSSVADGEAALRAGAFVAVIDLEDGILYSDTPPVKNHYPRLKSVVVDESGITITTADPATDVITWYVGNTQSAGNLFAYATIRNPQDSATVYTQAFVLEADFQINQVDGTPQNVLNAVIDVDPWSPANAVSPDSGRLVYVAIFGSSIANGAAVELNVNTIDPTTVRFGEGLALSYAAPAYADYNYDSLLDITLTFNTSDSGIQCDDADVSLNGKTYSGLQFEGSDVIQTLDCDTAGCHP